MRLGVKARLVFQSDPKIIRGYIQASIRAALISVLFESPTFPEIQIQPQLSRLVFCRPSVTGWYSRDTTSGLKCSVPVWLALLTVVHPEGLERVQTARYSKA